MAIDHKHPLYEEFVQDWVVMRDTYRGERVVKDRGRTYLPATSGMIADGLQANQPGWETYQSYKTRAVFHDFVSDAVSAAIGIMHRKPPVVELPSELEPLREAATRDGEGLEALLRRINEEQLVTGRLGILLDMPAEPTSQPKLYLALYHTEDVLNWDDDAGSPNLPKLQLVVLNESGWVRDETSWEFEEGFRVLTLNEAGVYGYQMLGRGDDLNVEDLLIPNVRRESLDTIPFVFINSKDTVTAPDDPPLIGLAKLALAIYRGEADYRQNLFMQGQDTLVVIGAPADDGGYRIGAGATIVLTSTEADAKYIGVSATGLAEQRESLENDKLAAAHRAGQLVDQTSDQPESGRSRKIRMAAQTATLNQVALSGAAGLEQLLRTAARWVGADPTKVEVHPNLDFVDDEMTGRTLVELMTARTMGAPISKRSVHALMRRREITELDYEEELDEIAEEEVQAAPGEGVVEDEPEPIDVSGGSR